MRVLQLIDSLEAGGAERVAINFANALTTKIESSFLCATRKEGILKNSLSNDASYFFLGKRSAIDIKSLLKLKSYIKANKIQIIHAHSTSFFTATIVYLLYPKVKVIWHDHYGKSEFLNKRKYLILYFTSYFFSHIICVNEVLAKWAIEKLKCKRVDYLANFAMSDIQKAETTLLGERGKRIIHLANLRPQKDHNTLLSAFKKAVEKFPDWTLHCVGKNFEDDYSKKIIRITKELNLKSSVFFYGSRRDISNILKQSTIGVLSSKSEGLPLALLEYGLAGLPAISTGVGDCSKVISNQEFGLLIKNGDEKALEEAIVQLISDQKLRKKMGTNLKEKVLKSFSKDLQINKLLEIYKSL